ncbi:MAG: 1-acyl-sn-glycerol-3-phosphate acyltransferase [Actinobacteria bacterium]|nr:1-acyl-sn-glycerol-3-phosphate acyltransferase [Actinomycetota bacterium]MCA1722114.1 1-acyl-sn-glycerol-3-phosphate acyltransferase [Actinomycetota bacterium]
MRLPPRPVRRLLDPLLLVLLLAVVVLLPVLVLVAVVVSPRLPGRWRGLRLLALALVWVVVEWVGVFLAFLLWVASGFGWKLRSERFQRVHYRLLRSGLGVIVRTATRLMRLQLQTEQSSWSPLDDGMPGSTNAMLVLSRHAGPGDSVLLVHTLMNADHLREPRIVLKADLQADPLVDVYLNRLPSRFIRPGPEAEEAISTLASDLGSDDALLIFPEGGNFTPGRRSRAIAKLRRKQMHDEADKAEAMKYLLPPRPGGVQAALAAAPHADVVFVAHTGLDHLMTLGDIWRELPQDKVLKLRWSFVPAADVPRDDDAQVDWLYGWWADMDAWIAAS